MTMPNNPTQWEIEDKQYWLADVMFLLPWDDVSAYSGLYEKQFVTSDFKWVKKKYFTYEEVTSMLGEMHEHYQITETDKFREKYLSNFSD
jgi:hypothetical protein